MLSESFGVVNDLAPVFRPYIQNVYQDLKLGLCKTKVDFERVSGNSEGGESQIRIVLPYCSKKLKWEIIFDATAPWFAPDFRFDDDSFLMNVNEHFLEEKVPSLSKWNENDPKALSDVISELINLYKLHQIKKLNEDDSSRAYFEYSALLGDALTSEQDIEVWVGSHVVEFLIRLKVDTSRLPELYTDGVEKNPGIDTALLLVRYPNSTNAELILSPVLTKSLGNISLPLMHQSGVLMDYVPMVTELLNNKINDLLNNEKLKRDLLAQLIVKYEGAVLEHDANNAAFLFEMSSYHWILQIDIGAKFPDKPPVLTLRSIYHCSKGKPMYKILSGCPYNHFESYIEQQVELFKNECMGVPPTRESHQFVTLEN
ncbi:hypothetical protein PYW07_015243 [Mythimna separata]|uniref:BRISC and BRCA1-A complex member 2 n=1 Tax=Mythimna separata TaxID=271217 RepID=A0AAD7YY65_MYTSE|nr:hypothetical protein PYW07_015243 [Mythimna separata]